MKLEVVPAPGRGRTGVPPGETLNPAALTDAAHDEPPVVS